MRFFQTYKVSFLYPHEDNRNQFGLRSSTIKTVLENKEIIIIVIYLESWQRIREPRQRWRDDSFQSRAYCVVRIVS